MKFTLRQLQVFVQVAHEENISRAAVGLSMSQSAASGALKELESHFNVQLFDRVGKRLRLNALGRALMPQAEYILAQAKTFELSLADVQIPTTLNIGATHTIGNYLAIKLLADYLLNHPGQDAQSQPKVEIHIANTQEITRGVVGFDLDVGLVEGEVNETGLVVEPWQADALTVFCSPQDPLAQLGRALTDEDLIDAQWILREQGSGTRQAFERSCAGIFSKFRVLLELDHTPAIKQAVAEGLGVSCLSMSLLQDEIALGKLVPLSVSSRQFDRCFYLLYRHDKFMSASMLSWLALCRNWTQLKVF